MKAIIIGGGIGGLSAAIALQRVGIEAAVFEQAAALREIGAGLSVWTNAVKALRKLGAGEAVLATGSVVERFEARTWRGEVLAETPFGEIGRKLGAPNLIIHRAELLNGLTKLIDERFIHCDSRCVELEQNSHVVRARFADGRKAEGDLLIGADGLHSVIRAKLFGESKPRYAGYTCWRGLAQFVHQEFPAGYSFESWGPGRRFAIHHCGPGRVFWYATKNLPEGMPVGAAGHQAEVLTSFEDWHTPIPQVIKATESSAILRNDIVDRKPVKHWGQGWVTLLGDAAHPTTPNLGQGACQAIEDAVVLASCLRATNDVPAALCLYENQRRARTADVTNQSWLIGKICQWENPLACWLRNRLCQTTLARQSGLRMIEKLFGYEVPDLG
jgi:2-polyprenyl-6-methoxyphenol hydroxylase-like FAD-dependent oxidoreductase